MEPVAQSAVAGAHDVLERAIADQVFPCAVAEVGDAGGVLWRTVRGSLTFETDAAPVSVETVFDLASLTKPIATTTVVLRLAAAGRLGLDDRVAASFPEWRGTAREAVTVRDLLEHASGLPPRLLDRPPKTRREFEHDICSTPLETAPRTKATYTDLGFILLGFIAERRGDASLDQLFAKAIGGRDDLAFTPTLPRARIAPTRPMADDERRGRWLIGEVHDTYSAALGGVAGHAGLFGTCAAVGEFGRGVLCAARGQSVPGAPLEPETVAQAVRRSSVPGSSRALGWDTMLPTSSCGSRMSPAAFGHVGFTGTSLWIDPQRGRYFVLLTNCAAGTSTREQLLQVRRAFHDALAGM